MSSQMVTLSVVMHCGVVGVLGEIVKFGCSLMRIVHGIDLDPIVHGGFGWTALVKA